MSYSIQKTTNTKLFFCALFCMCSIFCYIQHKQIQAKIYIFDSNPFTAKQVFPHKNVTSPKSRATQSTSKAFSYNYSVTTKYMKSSLWCGNSLVAASGAICNTSIFESKPRIIVAMDDTSWPVNEFNLGAYNCPHIQCSFISHSEIHKGGYAIDLFYTMIR